MNGRLVAMVVLAVGLTGLVGCSTSTPGTGTPVGSSSSAGSSSSNPNSSALAAIQPCSVLTSSEISRNGLSDQEASTGSGARSCTWSNNSFDNGAGYALEVDIRDSQGLKDINTDGYAITDDSVGGHRGKQAQQTSGAGCFVSIGVSPTSRVDVSAETSADVNQACTLANQYAKLIEPKLP